MSRPVIGLIAFSVTVDNRPHYGIDAPYVRAVVAHGGLPFLIPPGQDDTDTAEILEKIDGLLVPGGTDISPQRYGETPRTQLEPADLALEAIEFPLVARAYQEDMPILGICRGHQTLAVALGGTLYQDVPTDHGATCHLKIGEAGWEWTYHGIRIDPGSQLGSLLQRHELEVNSSHHQAIRTLPDELVISASAPDGIIEGIEAPAKRFVLGVQCHPEEIWEERTPELRRLFSAFIAAAAERSGILDSSHGAVVRQV